MCLSIFLSYRGSNSSCALLKYDVKPIILFFNLISFFILSGLFISIKLDKKSSNLSGSAKLYFIPSNVAEILLSLNNLIIFS